LKGGQVKVEKGMNDGIQFKSWRMNPKEKLILVQFPWEINRPSEVQSSRFPRNSATLRPLKVEAGINGRLPTSWVPSIYSVSLLSRLRYALER